MKPSERAKQLGFKTLREAARILKVSHKTLEAKYKTDPKKFDDLLIGAKHKLTMLQIDFYRDCADRQGVTFEQWLKEMWEI
jgi:hypothetical protein